MGNEWAWRGSAGAWGWMYIHVACSALVERAIVRKHASLIVRIGCTFVAVFVERERAPRGLLQCNAVCWTVDTVADDVVRSRQRA